MFRRLTQIIFILICLGGLLFISAQTLRSPTTHTTENRALTPKPDLPNTWRNADAYVKQLESWWNDSVHYRQYFIRISALMRMAVGINPHGPVLVGKNGWFFWTGERSDEAFRNNNPLTEDEMQRWRHYLVFRHYDAIKHGSHYYFIMVPNKENAYPEYMPDNFTRLGTESWIDQIVEATANDGIHIIDLRQILEEAKRNNVKTYTQLDTHWNLVGANYAQYVITNTLSAQFPRLQPALLPAEAFYDAPSEDFMHTNILFGAGLSYTLNIHQEELQPIFKKRGPTCAQSAKTHLPPAWESMDGGQNFHSSSCNKGHYRAVMYRDSFTSMLEPYLSESFRYITYIWLARPNDLNTWDHFVKNTDPDVIMDQIIERYLALVPKPGVDYPEDFDANNPTGYKKPIAIVVPPEADALFLQANSFYSGADGTVDKPKAFNLYKKAADLGHPCAMMFMGIMYHHGEAVPADIGMSMYWLKQSERAGCGPATEWIANIQQN